MADLPPIPTFIPSKDRACQLHLLLEGLHRHFPGVFDPHVYFQATSSDHDRSYDLLRERLLHGSFGSGWPIRPEVLPLRDHFLDHLAMATPEDGLVAIFTDDTLVFRSCGWGVAELAHLLSSPSCFQVSLRLGGNTIVQDYSTGRLQPPLGNPITSVIALDDENRPKRGADQALQWHWHSRHWTDNYGYPISMDGVVYRARDLLALTRALPFTDFRTWEGALTGPERRNDIQKRWMAAPTRSCCVNVPANTVQDPPIPSGRFHALTTEELCQRYLAGEVIDLSRLDYLAEEGKVKGAHLEVPYSFRPFIPSEAFPGRKQ